MNEPIRCRFCNEPLGTYPWGVAERCGNCQRSQNANNASGCNTRISGNKFNPHGYFQNGNTVWIDKNTMTPRRRGK